MYVQQLRAEMNEQSSQLTSQALGVVDKQCDPRCGECRESEFRMGGSASMLAGSLKIRLLLGSDAACMKCHSGEISIPLGLGLMWVSRH